MKHSLVAVDVKALASPALQQSPGPSHFLICFGFDFGVSLGHGLQHRLWAASRCEAPEELTDIVEERIGHRRHQERQEETEALSTDDHHCDRTAFLGAWTRPDREGSMPATSARVVIRIGRSRSRFATMMACRRSIPRARRLLVWSICKMEFFFTTPKRTRMPRAEYRLRVASIP